MRCDTLDTGHSQLPHPPRQCRPWNYVGTTASQYATSANPFYVLYHVFSPVKGVQKKQQFRYPPIERGAKNGHVVYVQHVIMIIVFQVSINIGATEAVPMCHGFFTKIWNNTSFDFFVFEMTVIKTLGLDIYLSFKLTFLKT